jgi:hypothetical protein
VTILVVLILVALWVIALAPLGVRRLRERRGTASIESFHQQLHLLERTGPKVVAPANRLETAYSHTGLAPGQSGFPAVSSAPPRRPSLVLVSSASGPLTGAPHQLGVFGDLSTFAPVGHGASDDAGHLAGWAAREAHAAQRRRGRRHRRDVVVTLLLVVVLTASLGALHGLHLLWVLTGLGVLGLFGCVALAAYAQLLEADQRALRPVGSERTSPWDWADERKMPAARSQVVEVARHSAARAGYPGAWDEDLPVARAATGG